MELGGRGFYPASHRGVRASGTAKSYDAARATFETAWHWLLPQLTEADFTEFRRQHAKEEADNSHDYSTDDKTK
jgi:hypothetical protein